jgi:hypothetical protein
VSAAAANSGAYLSICAIYRDEAPYLPEWIEFHALMGVDRFFLYDNFSTDGHREALAPYLRDGTVLLTSWPKSPPYVQFSAYEHCLRARREDSRWIAFIDLDEFLFSPAGHRVCDVLTEYERAPAVAVNWAVFGTSGHRSKPPGLVIENYVRRTNDPGYNTHVKSIVDPRRTELYCDNPHFFFYYLGSAVDENHQPVSYARTKQVSFEQLRINHYWTKSLSEAKRKVSRIQAGTGEIRPWPDFDELERTLNERLDVTITSYAPAVRRALLRRGVAPEASTA